MGNKITKRRPVVEERYTRPQGLYQHKDVDHRKLRRLILDAKLAPCFPGVEDASTDLDECPICFLFYPSLNRSKCCMKEICTECFLQMKSPHASRPTQCPFCKTASYAVEYRGAKSMEEKKIERAEEQRVIEAKIRIRQKELQDEELWMQRKDECVQEGSGDVEEEHPNTITHAELDSGAEEPGHVEIPAAWPLARRSLRNQMVQHSIGDASVHDRGTQVLSSSLACINRDEEFDFDLEDIMVMEAIWLSIQEQGISAGQSSIANLATSPSRSLTGRTYIASGLAGAIAALAEQQTLGTDSSTVQQVHQNFEVGNEAHENAAVMNHNVIITSSEQHSAVCHLHGEYGDGVPSTYITPASSHGQLDGQRVMEECQNIMDTNHEAEEGRGHEQTWMEPQDGNADDHDVQGVNNWIEVSLESGRALSSHLQEESHGSVSDLLLDHSSEAVEIGTSLLPSSISSASELPLEAPDILPVPSTENVIDPQVFTSPTPESFEEQIMFAMALSLVEAQAQAHACIQVQSGQR
eukprot:c28524_g1_i1 orf=126-1697(+)